MYSVSFDISSVTFSPAGVFIQGAVAQWVELCTLGFESCAAVLKHCKSVFTHIAPVHSAV